MGVKALEPCKPLRHNNISRQLKVAVSCTFSKQLLHATAGAVVVLGSCALATQPAKAESAPTAQTTVRTETRKLAVHPWEHINYKTLQVSDPD